MKRKPPEQLLTHDWETYYANDYSLSKMTTLDYVMDRRFEPLCLSVKVDKGDAVCIHGGGPKPSKRFRELLMDSGWERSLVVAHHNRFDAAIDRFRLKLPAPAMYGCTRLMARAIVRPYIPRVGLKDVARYYRRGEKGTQRETYIGYRLRDFSDAQLLDYMQYCAKDTELCHAIFGDMINEFPLMEMENIDIVLRMYLHPKFVLNAKVLTEHLAQVRADKEDLLARLPAGVTKDELMSNPKLEKVLTALGTSIPLKVSPATGKEAPAFAKTDPGFKELLEQGSPAVQAVCAARVGVKSTLEETRTERLLNIANRYRRLCVPLVYAGAHTLRYAGDEKLNMQNPTRGSRIRQAMEAPPGYEVTSADYAQIEARICATMAGCQRLVDAFKDPDRDPYAEQAAKTFGIPGLTKESHPRERWIAKTEVLQLQYQSGGLKLQSSLARGEGGKGGVQISERRAWQWVNDYRNINHEIPALWATCQRALPRMVEKQSFSLFAGCSILLGMLQLPNGFLMPYNNLQLNRQAQFVYQFGREWRTLYGGKLVENITQALSALLIREAMVRLYRVGVRTNLQVHDDLTVIHKKEDRNYVVDMMHEKMLVVPPWLPDLPLEIEVATGSNYLEVH